MKLVYRSSIPKHAAVRVVSRYAGGAMQEAEYLAGGEVVGRRLYFETGEPEWEVALRGGKRHGTYYTWTDPGVLRSAEPWRNGLQHGTARQWDDRGRLIGTYTLRNGTGWDLWRQESFGGGPPHLAEAIHFLNGQPHGFEWWLDEDQRTVFIERHWQAGEWHGIWRQWNSAGRLHRGYPQYHVRGTQVDKRRYLRAARGDASLPPFREQDNHPRRTFPPEVAAHLRP